MLNRTESIVTEIFNVTDLCSSMQMLSSSNTSYKSLKFLSNGGCVNGQSLKQCNTVCTPILQELRRSVRGMLLKRFN